MAKDGWSGRGFAIRRQDVEDACERLGIKAPVELKLTRYDDRYGTVGRLVGFRNGSWRIAIDTYLRPPEASRTVYHELAHVLQAERVGGMQRLIDRHEAEFRAARLTGRDQRRFFRARAAARTPLEQEAEQLARRWHRQFSLADRRSRTWR